MRFVSKYFHWHRYIDNALSAKQIPSKTFGQLSKNTFLRLYFFRVDSHQLTFVGDLELIFKERIFASYFWCLEYNA